MEEFKLLPYDELDKEMQTYTVTLIEPSAFATPKINNKFIRVQGCKDRVQSIVEDAIKNTNVVVKAKDRLTMQIEREKAKLMVNDEDIKKLSSADKRDAALMVHKNIMPLADELMAIEHLLLDAKDFEERAKLRYENLESTNKNLSRLVSTFGVMFMRGEIQQKGPGASLNLDGGE